MKLQLHHREVSDATSMFFLFYFFYIPVLQKPRLRTMVKRMEPLQHDRAVGTDTNEQMHAPSGSSRDHQCKSWAKGDAKWPQPDRMNWPLPQSWNKANWWNDQENSSWSQSHEAGNSEMYQSKSAAADWGPQPKPGGNSETHHLWWPQPETGEKGETHHLWWPQPKTNENGETHHLWWPQPKTGENGETHHLWWPQPKNGENGDTHHQVQMAAANWWHERPKSTAVETETSPADLLQAKCQSEYWHDIEFLEKHEQKDRKRRQAYRFNLKERRWEAAERVAMLEEDQRDFRPFKRKKLSTQVMEIAQQNEAKAVTTLSNTLPGTPDSLKHHQNSDDEEPKMTDEQKPPQDKTGEPVRTKPDLTGVEQKSVQFAPWIIQTFHENPPIDLGGSHPRIERKDAKFRWASYSRLPPKLNGPVKRSLKQVVAPPFGIQLIEEFRRWQAQQSSLK